MASNNSIVAATAAAAVATAAAATATGKIINLQLFYFLNLL